MINKIKVFYMFYFYFNKGIPLGLSTTVLYLLQSDKKKTFVNLATFSLIHWPFSLKILWAPIVDALYIRRIGRRKSWIMPVQYLIGIILIILAYNITDWFGLSEKNVFAPLGSSHSVKIYWITATFFLLTFLAATQDIVVDGWALTMLSK